MGKLKDFWRSSPFWQKVAAGVTASIIFAALAGLGAWTWNLLSNHSATSDTPQPISPSTTSITTPSISTATPTVDSPKAPDTTSPNSSTTIFDPPRPSQPTSPKQQLLAEMTYNKKEPTEGEINTNKLFYLNGKSYEHAIRFRCSGLCDRGPSVLTYDLGRNYSSLTAELGVNDKTEHDRQNAVVRVYVDDTLVESWKITKSTPQNVNLSLMANGQKGSLLRLEVSYGGNDPKADRDVGLDIVWGDPTLHP